MNALVEVRAAPALAMNETELCSVLQSSLYPGAKMESIKLVIGYCKAAGLDPMQKPVHIVPMNVKKPGGGRDDYEWRDVVMPGVGLYRTQAARTNALAGISEPEFGPAKTLKINDFECEYPEWCRVTVRRIVQNRVVDFTAVEYWIENYATKGKDSKVPNAMWAKRPRGQLAKCAQAQALRMGFPEMTGAAPTADEMEGKALDDGAVFDNDTGAVVREKVAQPQAKRTEPAAQQNTPPEEEREPSAASGTAEGEAEVTPENALKPGQVKVIQAKLAHAALTDLDFKAKWGKPLTDEGGFPNFRADQANSILAWINERAGG